MRAETDTPHRREQAQIATALGGHERADGKAVALQTIGGRERPEQRHVALAALLSVGELEALLLAAERMPETRWKHVIEVGHHRRDECLERKGEWCRGIGNHEPICASCPTRNDDRRYVKKLLGQAVELRREWDEVMWRDGSANDHGHR